MLRFVMSYIVPRRDRAAIVSLSVLVYVVVSLIGLVPPTQVYADDDAAPTVGDIRVDGLRRTREQIVLDLIRTNSGDRFTDDLVEQIRIALIDSELFASIDVTATPLPIEEGTDPTVDIVITVSERWTLVPIPFVAAGGGNVQGGLILIESNLFGRNKQAISGGFFSGDGASGFLGYIDPSIFQSRWATSVSSSFGVFNQELLLPDETKIREFDFVLLRMSGSIGYRFTDDLTLRTGIGYETLQIEADSFAPGQEPLEDADFFIPELGFEWDGTRPIEVLRFGPRVELEGRLVTYQDGREVSGEVSWGVPVFGIHRINLLASGGYGSLPTLSETIISAADGYRTLPFQSIAADRWGSVAAYYDFPVLNQQWGALVLSHFWEYGAYDSDAVEQQEFFGPGGAFRVFIRQVAIPALGLNVGYNIEAEQWAVSFTIGAQM